MASKGVRHTLYTQRHMKTRERKVKKMVKSGGREEAEMCTKKPKLMCKRHADSLKT